MAIPRTSSPNALVVALALGSVSCGAYVKYDGKDPTQSVGAVDAGLTVDLTPAGTFDHTLFSAILSKYVLKTGAGAEEQTLLDYNGIRDDALATAALANYRAALLTADPSALTGQTERLAFWFNAYNASVIAGVLASYASDPKFSVIDSGTFFNTRGYGVAGLMLSLDEIEHGVVRGVWDHPSVAGSPYAAKLRSYHAELWGTDKVDARLHVALNCGARSCPNLLPKAWLPQSLPQDLQAALEAFLANPVKGAGASGVSALFTWFEADFKNEAGSVSAFIEKNRKGGLNGVAVDKMLSYDWTLNIKR